jgi:ribosomal protein S12 methylthiotransferase accessory factor
VPVLAAVSARLDHAVEDIIFGLAADFDAATALRRALLEMHQSLYLVAERDGAGSTHYHTDRPASLRWFRNATRANQSYLVPDTSTKPVHRTDYSWPRYGDWADDLSQCVEVMRGAELEVLVLNQTRPDVGLPVMRVVAPGLCHIWPRLGTRRLFEMPVRMNWLDAPKSEAELNRWPIYF